MIWLFFDQLLLAAKRLLIALDSQVNSHPNTPVDNNLIELSSFSVQSSVDNLRVNSAKPDETRD